jgi:hypothetical protein
MDAKTKSRAIQGHGVEIAMLLVGLQDIGNDRMMDNGRRISVLRRIVRLT